MFRPVPSSIQVTLDAKVSPAAASYIDAAVQSGRFTQDEIVEAGVLMFLAHVSGRINILGPDGAAYVRAVADVVGENLDTDMVLAQIVRGAASALTGVD